MKNPKWSYVNNGRVKHLVQEVGEGDKTTLVAVCGFVPALCWRTTTEAMPRCKDCCKDQKRYIAELEKLIERVK